MHEKTLNLAFFDTPREGPGYSFDGYCLTLRHLHLESPQGYGIVLPAGCRVLLEGENTIQVAEAGVAGLLLSNQGARQQDGYIIAGPGSLRVIATGAGAKAIEASPDMQGGLKIMGTTVSAEATGPGGVGIHCFDGYLAICEGSTVYALGGEGGSAVFVDDIITVSNSSLTARCAMGAAVYCDGWRMDIAGSRVTADSGGGGNALYGKLICITGSAVAASASGAGNACIAAEELLVCAGAISMSAAQGAEQLHVDTVLGKLE